MAWLGFHPHPEGSAVEFSPLDFQVGVRRYYEFIRERHYWLQYTEWWVRPHLLRFSALTVLFKYWHVKAAGGHWWLHFLKFKDHLKMETYHHGTIMAPS